MKKINIDINKLKKDSKNSNWQRSIFWALLFSAIVFSIACLYLMFKPLSSEIKEIVDEDISSSDVIFNQETLESLKERQNPEEIKDTSSGKNPFESF